MVDTVLTNSSCNVLFTYVKHMLNMICYPSTGSISFFIEEAYVFFLCVNLLVFVLLLIENREIKGFDHVELARRTPVQAICRSLSRKPMYFVFFGQVVGVRFTSD